VPLPAWALGFNPEPIPVAPTAAEPVAPVAALAPLLPAAVAAHDDCPAWEQGEQPGEPCPVCDSLEYWQDLLGGRHCQQCDGRKLAHALGLLRTAARIRSRKK